MLIDDTLAISPIDGRYANKTSSLRTHFSEAALISSRIKIELLYLEKLAKYQVIPSFSQKDQAVLDLLKQPQQTAVQRVKAIEEQTHHDVKAVEYYLREEFAKHGLDAYIPFIHFALTSEDTNNLSYRLMIGQGLQTVLWPSLLSLLEKLERIIADQADQTILARTHGQAAIPTTFGKEMAVFAERLLLLFAELRDFRLRAKLNGAVGGYQAMHLAYPDVDWPALSAELITDLGFDVHSVTTQIASPDDLIKLFSIFYRINGVLLDLNQDLWRYISDGWLLQKGKEKFVGSSTMPQKINPIEFENSEGNITMANAMFEGMMRKLPVSRLQRDLSDSTVMRNVGVVFAHCLLAYQSLSEGLEKLAINEVETKRALLANYNILFEAWQTLARKTGDDRAYEKAALLSKNKVIIKEDWLMITKDMPSELYDLNPENYLGLSVDLAHQTAEKIKNFIQAQASIKTI